MSTILTLIASLLFSIALGRVFAWFLGSIHLVDLSGYGGIVALPLMLFFIAVFGVTSFICCKKLEMRSGNKRFTYIVLIASVLILLFGFWRNGYISVL